VNAILDAVTQSALEISSADRSELFLVDYRKRALKLFSTAAPKGRDPLGAKGRPGNGVRDGSYYPLNYGLPGWSITHNQPLAVRRAELDSRHVHRPEHPELDQSSVVTLPLCYRGRVVGAIAVYSLDGRAFDLEKQEVLQTFANQVAVALQNAELYQNLRSEQERIIKAQEEVRHHLARELHDNTAQMLSLITMNLDLSRRLLAEGQFVQVQTEIDEMQKLARQANREVRTLLFELRPIILESRGLIPALHAYHRQLEASMSSKIHLDAPALSFTMTLQAASAIFSVIQEAVNNIRKHAKAQNIWIRVTASKEQLTFIVEDDGLGFDVAEVMDQYDLSGSFGLRNMQERVRHLSGKLIFQSPRLDAERGALVTGVIPVATLVDPNLTSPSQ
jgi:signal transduction histidine kinase